MRSDPAQRLDVPSPCGAMCGQPSIIISHGQHGHAQLVNQEAQHIRPTTTSGEMSGRASRRGGRGEQLCQSVSDMTPNGVRHKELERVGAPVASSS